MISSPEGPTSYTSSLSIGISTAGSPWRMASPEKRSVVLNLKTPNTQGCPVAPGFSLSEHLECSVFHVTHRFFRKERNLLDIYPQTKHFSNRHPCLLHPDFSPLWSNSEHHRWNCLNIRVEASMTGKSIPQSTSSGPLSVMDTCLMEKQGFLVIRDKKVRCCYRTHNLITAALTTRGKGRLSPW